MALEAAQIVPWAALAVSSLVAIRSEWRARQITDESLRAKVDADLKALRQVVEIQEVHWRQRHESHHDKLIVMEAKLAPLFTVFDKRLAEMLHQPHPDAYEVDQLLEKYQENPDALTDLELNRLTGAIFQRYERMKNSDNPQDQTKALVATMYLAILDSHRATRQIVRQQEIRNRAEQAHREALLQYLRDVNQRRETQESWWTRLQKFLGGSSSSCY
jgi:hypothetical protein